MGINQFILCFAWFWILAGLATGTGIGLGFHRSEWLGGYTSWRRRLMRLGHIAFFGTALLNIALVLTAEMLEFESVPTVAGIAMVIGAISMPTVCYLSAYRESFRHLFFIPVTGLIVGTVSFAISIVAKLF